MAAAVSAAIKAKTKDPEAPATAAAAKAPTMYSEPCAKLISPITPKYQGKASRHQEQRHTKLQPIKDLFGNQNECHMKLYGFSRQEDCQAKRYFGLAT